MFVVKSCGIIIKKLKIFIYIFIFLFGIEVFNIVYGKDRIDV